MVGAEVYHQHVRAELRGELRGVAVRQGEEDDVVPAEGLGGRVGQRPAGQRHQVRLVGAQLRAGAARRGERADLDLGMGEQQAQQFAARVPARSRHRDLHRHTYDYARPCKPNQTDILPTFVTPNPEHPHDLPHGTHEVSEAARAPTETSRQINT